MNPGRTQEMMMSAHNNFVLVLVVVVLVKILTSLLFKRHNDWSVLCLYNVTGCNSMSHTGGVALQCVRTVKSVFRTLATWEHLCDTTTHFESDVNPKATNKQNLNIQNYVGLLRVVLWTNNGL